MFGSTLDALLTPILRIAIGVGLLGLVAIGAWLLFGVWWLISRLV